MPSMSKVLTNTHTMDASLKKSRKPLIPPIERMDEDLRALLNENRIRMTAALQIQRTRQKNPSLDWPGILTELQTHEIIMKTHVVREVRRAVHRKKLSEGGELTLDEEMTAQMKSKEV